MRVTTLTSALELRLALWLMRRAVARMERTDKPRPLA